MSKLKELLKNPIARALTALLVFLFVGSLACIAVYLLQDSSGTIAEITQNGKVIERIRLDQVTETYTFKIEGKEGSYNIVEVKPGSICIKEASCPDKLCVKLGEIHTTGLPITCLPNKVVIKITQDDSADNSPDEVTY